MKKAIILAVVGVGLATLGVEVAHAMGMRCGICNGTGFQGNFVCMYCKGTGQNSDY